MDNRVIYYGDQQNDEWFKRKLGLFSSSNIYKLLTEPRSKKDKENGILSKTAQDYILEKAVEELYGVQSFDFDGSSATDWGNDNERIAAAAFEDQLLIDLDNPKISFIDMGGHGSSPDDSFDGVPVEYKCPYKREIHIKHCLLKTPQEFAKYSKQYYAQVQHQIYCMGSDIGYWMSYDPRLRGKNLERHILEVPKDEAMHEKFSIVIPKAIELKNQMLEICQRS